MRPGQVGAGENRAWKDSAVLLVGHGSSRQPTSRQATLQVAEAIRRQGRFAEVEACFWREPPFLSLELVKAPRIYVVPHFAGAGILTGELIPGRLGLSGPLTVRDGRSILYARPVGSHPAVPALLRRDVLALCAERGIDPGATALVVVGHGSNQPGRSSGTPEAVAAALRAAGGFAEVAAAFIEQAPRVADWPKLVAAPTVVAAPLLISEGMHARRDLPPLFGLAEPSGGPGRMAGRDTWLMPGIGRLAEVAELILDQIRGADADAAGPAARFGHKLRMEPPADSGHCWPPVSAA